MGFSEFEVLLPPGEFEVQAKTELKSALSSAIHVTVYDLKWLGPLDVQEVQDEVVGRALQEAGQNVEEDEQGGGCTLL
jgi:hypothetical protein